MRLKTRHIRSYDIHWRNIELLTQFISKNGGIKSRFVTCLPIAQHKKMKRAIATARSMQLLPNFGFPPPMLNRNLRSL
jgi:ribosomal protein S18